MDLPTAVIVGLGDCSIVFMRSTYAQNWRTQSVNFVMSKAYRVGLTTSLIGVQEHLDKTMISVEF